MNEYKMDNFTTYAILDNGDMQMLANFVASITKETRIMDGDNVDSIFTIGAQQPPLVPGEKPRDLPEATVTARDFPAMGWVMPQWGSRAVIAPAGSAKEKLRACIQLNSNPAIVNLYKHLGWTADNRFLHAGGAISAKGNDPSVLLSLPPELNKFNMTPDKSMTLPDAAAASVSLSLLAPPEISWVLLAATFAPVIAPVDFGVHLSGRTGTFKSEVCSLFQSHFGPGLDARNLPGSWSSTPNALEALAYYAKDCVLTVDDFVPAGSSYQIKQYHSAADKLIRAQGNQAGRARLTDTSNLQRTMYPRGLILSTGEDVPEGHSVRARLMIMEMSPGDIEAASLSKAQKNRPFYAQTMYHFIRWLAGRRKETSDVFQNRTEQVRDELIGIGHSRTPGMTGRLVAAIEVFLKWCYEEAKIFQEKKYQSMLAEAVASIKTTAGRQQSFLQTADPCDQMMSTLRQALGAGMAHFRSLQGGVPLSPTLLGWTEETIQGAMPTYKAHGPCIGWIDWTKGEIYLDANVGFATLKKLSHGEMATTRQTLMKRLKDAGFLSRADDARQRNTVRITAAGHSRQVVALSAAQVLDTQECPADEAPEEKPIPLSSPRPARPKKK